MHSEVLTLLDEHLAELHALRRHLADARVIRPGERWLAAAATASSAHRYACGVARVLAGEAWEDDLATSVAGTADSGRADAMSSGAPVADKH